MAKKRLSKEERRIQLLDAAAKCFGASSFGQVTTADLAKAADVSEPVLYQHFKTKIDLYVAVLEHAAVVAFETYERLADSMPTPLLKLIAVVRGHGDVMRDNEPYFRLHLRAIANSDIPEVKDVLRQNYLAYNKYFADLIREAQACGEVHRAVDPVATSWFIMSQGQLMNLCNQLDLTELQEKGYVDGLLQDALAHVALIDDPSVLIAKLMDLPS